MKYRVPIATAKVIHSVHPPSYLTALLKQYVPESYHRSAGQNAGKGLLCVPKVSKTKGRRGFTYSAPNLWNSVDPDLHTPVAIETFRKNLRRHLYSGIYRD